MEKKRKKENKNLRTKEVLCCSSCLHVCSQRKIITVRIKNKIHLWNWGKSMKKSKKLKGQSIEERKKYTKILSARWRKAISALSPGLCWKKSVEILWAMIREARIAIGCWLEKCQMRQEWWNELLLLVTEEERNSYFQASDEK